MREEKEIKYVCMFEEKDGFMYYHYFSSKKKAKKFMEKQIKEYDQDAKGSNTLPLVGAALAKIVKIYNGFDDFIKGD